MDEILMEKFRYEQLQEEYLNVCNKYFSDVEKETEFQKVPGRPCKVANVLWNGREYTLYRYSGYNSMIRFIPREFVEGFQQATDFDDVVSFTAGRQGISLNISRKKGELLENTNYSFLANEKSTDGVELIKNYQSSNIEDDKFSSAKKRLKTAEVFFVNPMYYDMIGKGKNLTRKHISIVRNMTDTYGYVDDLEDIMESCRLFVDQKIPFEKIDDQNSSLFDLADQLGSSKKK